MEQVKEITTANAIAELLKQREEYVLALASGDTLAGSIIEFIDNMLVQINPGYTPDCGCEENNASSGVQQPKQ